MNILEKLTNDKLDKVKHKPFTETKEKKGFFRRIGDLFKKKDKNTKNEKD